MQGFFKILRRIWQRLRRWLGFPLWGRFANGKRRDSDEPRRGGFSPKPPSVPLADAEYEFLFAELLQGVRRGWSRAQVLQFIRAVGSGPIAAGWVAWLRGFGDRLLAAPGGNRELAQRAIALGRMDCPPLGTVAAEIGQKLREVSDRAPRTPDPSEPSAIADCLDKGHWQLNRRQYASALLSFQRAAQWEPDNPEVAYGLGLASLRLGLFRQAIEQFDRALAVAPEDLAAIAHRGLAYDALERGAEAIAECERVLDLDARSARDWCARGRVLLYLRRPHEAIAAYDRALALEPTHARVWYERGNVLYDLQDYPGAIAAYDEALQYQPDYAPAWLNRGAACGNLGHYQEAIVAFDRVLDLQPYDYHGWLRRGQTLQHLHKYAEAIAAFDRALQIRPDDPLASRYRNDAQNRGRSR